MVNRKLTATVVSALMLASIVLAACGGTTGPSTVVVTAPPQVVTGQPVVVTAPPVIQTSVVQVTTAAPSTPATKVMRVNLGTYPDIIDPQKSSFVNEIAVLQNIYEGLTRLNEKLETVPAAAEKWDISKDGTVYTFTIRSGAKYSDGSVLNAKRFEYAIIRNIDPATQSQYSDATKDVNGAEDWAAAAGADKPVQADVDKAKATVTSSVVAKDMSGAKCKDGKDGYAQADCRLLMVKLNKAAVYFPTEVQLWSYFPTKEESVTTGGDNWWQGAKYQIGNGPFIMTVNEPFTRTYFKPNPNYWGGVPKIDMEYRYVNDSAVAFQAYKNNEFEVVGLAPEDLKTVQADPVLSKEASITPGSCTFAFMFRQDKEPFNDKNVRAAFAYAFDRAGYVKDVLQGLGKPTLTWIPPGYPGYKEGETRYGFDLQKAKDALAASKYKDAAGLNALKLTATIGDTPRGRTRFTYIVNMYKQNLGIDIALNPVEPTTYTALTKKIETAPLFYILGWCADYPDPQDWLSIYWRSTSPFVKSIAFAHPELDKIMDQADVEQDKTKRAALYQQAQDMLIDMVPVAMLYNNVTTQMIKPYVTGYKITPQDSGYPGQFTPWTIDIDTSKLPKK